MTFSSLTFVIFFLLVLSALALIQGSKQPEARKTGLCHGLLLAASYVFYGWWDWRFCFLLFAVTAMSFLTAVPRGETTNPMQKLRFVVGIAVPLAALGFFKYANFFLDSFCTLFRIQHAGVLNIILPVGISFYTFQALSYNIDVYFGKISREPSFLDYALYISFFPQLVAGPIVKANEFLPQLKQSRRVTLPGIEMGVQIFLFGLFKKIVIADNLSVFVDDVFSKPTIFHSVTVWLAVISYAIQIYFDFSGYSDMAIGCAKCMGYDLAKNFDLPYISRNVTEFWKRWHISLSTWLQQYLYIPLGGNRKGVARTYINLMLTMVLGGLWHGNRWTFVIWGAMHGLALCCHKLYMAARKQKRTDPISAAVSILVTNLFVMVCWVFFRADRFVDALVILKRMFLPCPGILHLYTWTFVAIAVVAAGTITAAVVSRRKQMKKVAGFYPLFDLNTVTGLTVVFTTLLLILGLAYVQGNPFIYFQF